MKLSHYVRKAESTIQRFTSVCAVMGNHFSAQCGAGTVIMPIFMLAYFVWALLFQFYGTLNLEHVSSELPQAK